MARPFRWSIGKREQLGGLLSTGARRMRLDAEFLGILRDTSARVLAYADGADLAFIGRTPENLFDYLSGCFDGVNGAPRLHMAQFSLRWSGAIGQLTPQQAASLFDYFTAEGIGPADIAAGPRPLALVDFVAWGGTMESFIRLLMRQAERDGVDWNAVQRRLKIIGLRVRTKNSPNTQRWQQLVDWLHLVPDTEILNVSAPAHFLWYLGNDQPKVTRSFHPGRWKEEDESAETPSEDQLSALGFAVRLYDKGRTRTERQALARAIAATDRMRQPATRALVSLLKG